MRRILLLLLAMTSSAFAQDRFAELQIDAAPFAAFLRSAIIQEAGNPCPQSAPSQLCNGQSCYLERLDVRPGGTFRRTASQVQVAIQGLAPISTAQIQYVQPMRAYFKSLACIRDPSCARNNWATQMDLNLRLNLSVSGNQICITPAGFQEPVPAGALPAADPICSPLQLGAITQLAGPGMAIVGRGLSLNAAATRLAVRIELLPEGMVGLFPTAARTTAWQQFLNGTLSSMTVVGAPSWRLLVSAALLRASMVMRFSTAIAEDPQVELDGGVTGIWSHLLGDGLLGAHFFAEVDVSECPNLIGVEVDASMPLVLSGNALTVAGAVRWDVNDADAALCGAILGGFVFAPITMPIAGAIADSFAPDPAQLGLPAQCDASVSQVEDSTVDLDCTFPLAMPDVRVGNAFLTLAVGDAVPSLGGLVLQGTATGGGVTEQTPATSAVVTGGFSYGIQGGCGHFSAGYSGGLSMTGPNLCNIDILNDTKHVFDLKAISDSGPTTHIGIEFPGFQSVFCPVGPDTWSACPPGQAPLDQYWAAPYPLKTTLWTERGAFTVSVPGPVKATQAQQEALMHDIIMRRVNCMARETGLFGIPGLWNPQWEIDPAPDGYVLERVTRLGRETLGRVTLSEVSVSAPNSLVDSLGTLRTRAAPVQYEALAIVDAGARGRYRVPVSVPLSVSWSAYGRDGRLSGLRTAAAVSAPVDLSRALPAALAGAGFNLSVGAGGLRVVGR